MVHYQDRSKLINHHLTRAIIPASTPPCNNITDECQPFAVVLFETNLVFYNCVNGLEARKIMNAATERKIIRWLHIVISVPDWIHLRARIPSVKLRKKN